MKAINYLLSLGLVVCATVSMHAQDYKISVQNTEGGN